MMDTTIMPYLGLIPMALALYALVQGIRLSIKLKPGMVCHATTCCERCNILYGLEIGAVVLSFCYILSEIKWMLDGNFLKIEALDEISWLVYEAALS